ncbi:MAG: SgcJ/EcaC family oxidoreductase [Nevskia sp.]|nr:SgcJ/EcaC family oxidoreductase [Nevskia sp.]
MKLLKIALPLSLLCWAATAAATPEADVRAVIADVAAGYANFDARQVAANYTEDAVWENPFGAKLAGRKIIERFLDRMFAEPGFQSVTMLSPLHVTDVRFRTPDVAVVWSEESTGGQVDDRNGQPLGQRKSHFLQVLVRTAEGWRISDDMTMDEK